MSDQTQRELLEQETPGTERGTPDAGGHYDKPDEGLREPTDPPGQGQRDSKDQARPGGTQREQEAGKDHPSKTSPK